MKQYYGFWTLFETEENSQLFNLVKKFSTAKHDGSIFEPHLSVYPAVLGELDDIKSKLTAELSGFKKFSVDTDGYGMDDRWSKTLYVKIKEHPSLLELNQKLHSLFGDSANEENNYQPHVSLLYKLGLSEAERHELMQGIELPKQLRVSSLGIVDPGVSNDDWKDYVKWNVPFEVGFE